MSGIGPVMSGIGSVMSGIGPVMSRLQPVMSGIGPMMSGIWPGNNIDVWNKARTNWPYSGHRTLISGILPGKPSLIPGRSNQI